LVSCGGQLFSRLMDGLLRLRQHLRIRLFERSGQEEAVEEAPPERARNGEMTTPEADQVSAPKLSSSRQGMKQPSKEMIQAYRLHIFGTKTQKEIVEILRKENGRAVDQGTVSRWITYVKAFRAAGNVLPDLPEPVRSKPTPMDPKQIELGRRRDGRTERQRNHDNSDCDS